MNAPSPMNAAPMKPMKPMMPMKAGKKSADHKGESVEARIDKLHARLKITPAEDAAWGAVAQAMRENAVNMEKLIADKRAQTPADMTAVDDLKTYQLFAQAHVDGLKNLTTAFSTLYDGMPDAQKKLADQVFQSFGHEGQHRHMASKAN